MCLSDVFHILSFKLHKIPSIYISSIKYYSFDLNERIFNHRQHPKVIKIDSLLWPVIALRTDPKNRTSHGRPPARLRQTLTFVLKIREEKRPKTE